MSEKIPEPEEPTVTDADVLDVIDTMEPPAVTVSDVSNVLGCSRDVARRHLESLHEAGQVKRRKTSGVVLWWRPRGEVTRPDPIDMGETNSVEETESFGQD
ncbi:MarR family transcriptional regulator [Halarchaeum salinum]|uniref:Winged helix-turn-helix domain-containing protein n=1 Tax=Halarchaeum salinum TaxID=489912 RepID=A0AAV3S509_9EURY